MRPNAQWLKTSEQLVCAHLLEQGFMHLPIAISGFSTLPIGTPVFKHVNDMDTTLEVNCFS